MIDLGEYEPASAIGPTRETDSNGRPTGVTKLGRPTTTQEQRADAIAWILVKLNAKQVGTEAKALVRWSRTEPTILEVRAIEEHIQGKRLLFEGRVTEYTIDGRSIPSSAEARATQIITEVAEIAAEGGF